MKLRDEFTYSIVIPTSMGTRLTPVGAQPFHASDTFTMTVTSAESNVGSVASYLGMPVHILSSFVHGSPVARMIKDNLGHRHMTWEGPEVDPGGAWGFRHQINMADSGYGARGPRVHNDRAGEVARNISVADFDLDDLFGNRGARFVHTSGLFAALSPDTGQFCLEVARAASRHGTRICFDLNHRASFWEGRERELREVFSEIASLADVLVGNEEDFQLCLGIDGPEAGGQGIAGKIDGFKGMIDRVRERYTNASVFATTLREVVDANLHRWGAIVSVGADWYLEQPREIRVLDRIGGGDGFVGGLLYAILKGWEPARWVRFGWATGALAVTMLTDYAQPADEDQVWSIWEGNARVRR